MAQVMPPPLRPPRSHRNHPAKYGGGRITPLPQPAAASKGLLQDALAGAAGCGRGRNAHTCGGLRHATGICQRHTQRPFAGTGLRLRRDEGFACVELMCWPPGGSERRYAGVTHVDVTNLSDDRAGQIRALAQKYGIAISGLGYYPNPLDADPAHRRFVGDHLKRVIDAAPKLGVSIVNTFIGRDPALSAEANWPLRAGSLAGVGASRRPARRAPRHRELPHALLERRMARRQEPRGVAGNLATTVHGVSEPWASTSIRRTSSGNTSTMSAASVSSASASFISTPRTRASIRDRLYDAGILGLGWHIAENPRPRRRQLEAPLRRPDRCGVPGGRLHRGRRSRL